MLTMNVAVVSYLKGRVSKPNLSGSASSLRNPLFDIELRSVSNKHIHKPILITKIFK